MRSPYPTLESNTSINPHRDCYDVVFPRVQIKQPLSSVANCCQNFSAFNRSLPNNYAGRASLSRRLYGRVGPWFPSRFNTRLANYGQCEVDAKLKIDALEDN